jgi:glucose-1-phosphate adenylyltransferase
VLLPEVRVNRYARLKNVIVDRGCNIPRGLVVGEDPEEDACRFRRSDKGITLITRAMLERLG